MKFLIVLIALFLVSTSSVFAHEDWSLKNFALDKTLGATFIKHDEQTPYLSFNLNYEPFKEFFEKADQQTYRPLQNRGEAHVTVITPPEFQDDLSKFVSIQEVNEIANKLNIQKSTYKPICMGKGKFNDTVADKYLESYFIVIESEDLLNIRKEIANLYKKRGGTKFDPLHFYPHITLGFTDRDLHENDGVIKNAKSCMRTLHISPFPSTVPGLPISNASYVDQNKKGGAIIRGNAPLNHKNLKLMKEFGISEYIIFKNDKSGEVRGEINGLLESGIKKESIAHIEFDWKDNQDFTSGCKKFIQGIDLFKSAMKNNKKIFFHCTTGEDRTGALATNYLLSQKKGANIKKLFQKEMCDKGYEAGDPGKDIEIVEKIRLGLTKTFLKTAFRIDEAKKKHHPIDESICAVDPSLEKKYIKYSTQMNFVCGSTLKK
jgi:2'-5' RNA ligase